ncbi:hypothetical protein [Cognatilysobacter terrigena]|uniref:hypothetical protein n=1 Tax=Cognatilysobacter terrigena TaxID=2488749 RepID=UPI00105F5138|nr:hypothetical protein [Lysobacter terrigena]
MTAKSPSSTSPAPATSAFARRADVGRQITSEHIRDHVAAFEASGGIVERLGNTPLRAPQREPAGAKSKPSAT